MMLNLVGEPSWIEFLPLESKFQCSKIHTHTHNIHGIYVITGSRDILFAAFDVASLIST